MMRYEAYKDSGVDWIGEIPEHWDCVKLKYLIKSRTGFAFPSEKFEEKGIPLVRIGDLDVSGKVILTKCPKLPVKYLNFLEAYGLRKNDLLFAMTGGTIGKVAIFEEETEALLNQRVCSFTISNDNLRRIIFNWMQTYYWKNYINLKASGGAQPNISDVDVLELKIAISPLPEQTAIAQFLDNKTAKIDQLIGIKQKEIELLKERRQILIQQAVTGKWSMVNGQWLKTQTEKLKPSGVDWIGEIPEHWEVRKLVSLCRFVRGNSPFGKDELLSSGDYVAMQYGKTYKTNEVNEEYGWYVNKEFYKDSQVVNYGDVILVSTSETIEDLGHTVYYRRNKLGLLGGEQIMLKPKQGEIDSHFLYFSVNVFSKELRKFATGIKVFRFNINDLKTISNAAPPLSEQKEIAKFIEINSNKIAKAISIKEQEIEKLKEYKTVLIDNVVTGKVRIN